MQLQDGLLQLHLLTWIFYNMSGDTAVGGDDKSMANACGIHKIDASQGVI